jgi:hypothetical protein
LPAGPKNSHSLAIYRHQIQEGFDARAIGSYFDQETCRIENTVNPFTAKLSPMSPE